MSSQYWLWAVGVWITLTNTLQLEQSDETWSCFVSGSRSSDRIRRRYCACLSHEPMPVGWPRRFLHAETLMVADPEEHRSSSILLVLSCTAEHITRQVGALKACGTPQRRRMINDLVSPKCTHRFQWNKYDQNHSWALPVTSRGGQEPITWVPSADKCARRTLCSISRAQHKTSPSTESLRQSTEKTDD